MSRREGGKAVAAAESIGRENMTTLEDLIREVFQRVGPRVLEWRLAWGVEPLIGLIVMHTAIVTAREMRLGELAEEMRADKAELDRARSLRLARPSQAVDPAVHTPGRVRCYLKAHGWHLIAERETYDMWQLGREQMANAICVPTKPQASDYRKRLGIALGDLAQQYETGELAVLADIEAAGDA